jgi:two-component system, chemotaxis family, CheB/CheR fusion protein
MSLAEDRHESAIAVILSGSNGMDGPRGVRAVRSGGGMCMAQSPDTAKFAEMPRAAIDTGLVDYVLPVDKMPAALVEFAQFPRPSAMDGDPLPDEVLEAIIRLLHTGTNSDFRHYKRATIVRRIRRRMGLRQITGIDAYLKLLQSDAGELTQLGKDMLICVSSFFRDAHAFAELGSVIKAALAKEPRDPDAPLRAWVAGCSTGEEAYSIAMLLFEGSGETERHGRIQVFASDVDETALQTARAGIYPEGIADDVSPERLQRYFKKQGGGYQVGKVLREAVVFSRQNLLSDAPFSKLDLISCRNVLIYLEPAAHKKVLAMFGFALNVGGHLFLGKSEGIAGFEDYFESVSKRNRIYRLTQANRRGAADFPLSKGVMPRTAIGHERVPFDGSTLALVNQEALLQHFNASLVLIDARGKILYFHGQTERYLGHPKGLASLNILDLTEGALSARLRQTIDQALRQNEPVTFSSVSLPRGGAPMANLTVRQMNHPMGDGKVLAVIFEDAQPPYPSAAPGSVPVEDEPLVAQLEAEVRTVRQELRANAEAYEAANEELNAASEEVMSMNEELQSANEEIEASKEELQSLNEELNTVNSHLYEKVNDLTDINNDLSNLLSATAIATVFLDSQLRIKRFTPSATDMLNLLESDIGRPASHITANFTGVDLAAAAQSVLKSLVPLEKEVVTHDGRWFTLHVLPYRTQDNRIDGAVITFSDVSRLKWVETNLQFQKMFAETIVKQVRHPLIVLDGQMRVVSANPAFYQMFQVDPSESEGQLIFDLNNRQWDIPGLRELIEQIIPSSLVLEDFRIEDTFPQIGKRILLVSGHRILPSGELPERILLSMDDVTERENARQVLENLAEHRLGKIRELVMQMAQSEQQERQRLAHVLHDNMQQLLVSAKFPLKTMRSQTQDKSLLSSVHSVEELLDQILVSSRSLISDLSPSILYEAGLDAALPWLGRKMKAEHGLDVLTEINAKIPNDSRGVVAMLFQAVRELLLNVVKHAGVDRARVQLDQLDGHEVRIVVEDQGVGFDPDVAQSDHTKSTGLGLFGQRERLQYIGGSCEIESRPGAGTRVTLSAHVTYHPKVKQMAANPSTGKERGTTSDAGAANAVDGNIRVLLVDDHMIVRKGLAELLSKEPDLEIVAEATDGEEAVELARQFQPDVVIMDVVMPRMNGIEATRIITAELPETRIIGLSMYVEADRAEAMREAGAIDYLTKGGNIEDLVTAIRRPFAVK